MFTFSHVRLDDLPRRTRHDNDTSPLIVGPTAICPGTHTVTAVAWDYAGNTTTQTRGFTVTGYALRGFSEPVDMPPMVNTVKGGRAVPLKFEVFAGATELTSTATVSSFTAREVACSSVGTTADDIEFTTTGRDEPDLRHHRRPARPELSVPGTTNRCFTVTMTTVDGSRLSSVFKTK
jgi:hypothetical protein